MLEGRIRTSSFPYMNPAEPYSPKEKCETDRDIYIRRHPETFYSWLIELEIYVSESHEMALKIKTCNLGNHNIKFDFF